MINGDLISIIVAIYNVKDYIKNCIQSLLNQSYMSLEIILVDDGSTDCSGVICDEFSLKDSRIKVIHKKNGGLSDARNAGLKIATGDFIGFVDGDDEIDKNMYYELYRALKKHGGQIAFGQIVSVELDGSKKILYHDVFNNKSCVLDKYNALYYLASERYISPAAWNKLYRRELFNEIKFPYGKIYEDKFIMHELFDRSVKLVYAHEAKYYYFQRPNSIITSGFSKKKLDVFEACNIKYNFYLKNYPEFLNDVKTDICCQSMFMLVLASKAHANKCVRKLITNKIIKNFYYYLSSKQITIGEKIVECSKVLYFYWKGKMENER